MPWPELAAGRPAFRKWYNAAGSGHLVMDKKHVKIGDIDCGSEQLFLISGPCVIEAEALMMETAERLKGISQELGIPLIFKSSFSKDNRSSLEYFQGPGLEEGLKMLEKIKREFELPILTDIHYPTQAAPAATATRHPTSTSART